MRCLYFVLVQSVFVFVGPTLAGAVSLAGARDGAAYFDNPNTRAHGGGDSAELKPPPADEIGRMQISEEKLCVPIVVTASAGLALLTRALFCK
jgi:hypothetical protein